MISALSRKISFYKKLIFLIYFIFTVSVLSSFVLNGFYFFKKQQQFETLKEQSWELKNKFQNLTAVDEKLKNEIIQYHQNIHHLEKSAYTHQYEILLLFFCIIIFGVLLPYLLIKRIEVKIKDLEKELQNVIRIWVEEIFKKMNEYDEPFKNPEFLIQISTLLIESGLKFSDHPALQILAEISKIVRIEIAKTKKN